MSKIRRLIDLRFEQLGFWIVKRRWVILTLILILSVFMASRLPQSTFDLSTEGFLHEDDPSIIRYNDFRDQFGKDEMIVLMIKPDNVFTLEFLNKLRLFHEDLEENVPNLNDITSLINARLTKGAEGELLVNDLMESFPETEEDLQRLKNLIVSNPLYTNLLISEDGGLTAIIIKSNVYADSETEEEEGGDFGFDQDVASSTENTDLEERPLLSNEENAEMVQAIREIMAKYDDEDFPVFLSGSPVVTDFLKMTMQKDMKKFTGLAILAIAVFLFLFFRRISGVLLPLLTVILSVIYTFALMAITGTAIKLMLVILPSFLLAIGIGASVHLMSIFFQYLKEYDKTESISKALGHSGLPIVMTSITTATGIASFSQAELAPIADLGVFASLGVMFSLFLTIVLLPVMISLLPIRNAAESEKGQKTSRMDRILHACGDFAVDRYKFVLFSTFLIIAISIAGIFRLNVTHDVLRWFPLGSEIRENTELIDHKMKGTLAIEVTLDTKEENGLYEPDVLNKLEELSKRLMAYPSPVESMFVGKTISLVDLLKEINQAVHENKPEFYSIPQDRQLIAQELFLFENSGSDDLEDMVDSRFSKTHLTAKVPWNDSVTYIDFISYVTRNVDEIFGGEFEIGFTGISQILMTTATAMIRSTIKSYAIAAVIITLLMILLIGKIKIGFISMIPNLTPIVITLGLMGWFGINLDLFSMLIGSIAIGLAVDDTIHFFHNFKKYHDKSGNVKEAVQQTLSTTGRAMLVTTLVLATGFWLFMFATMNNLFYFGLLTGITLVFAFLADIIIAPALMAFVMRKSPNEIAQTAKVNKPAAHLAE
jgi:uncharacterized protein